MAAPSWSAQARDAAAHVFVDDLTAPVVGSEDRHHLLRVLRLRAGEAVSVSDGRGGWQLCRWQADGSLIPDGSPIVVSPPQPALTVAVAVVKGERPEWAVQKLTELGVDRIVPLLTERTVVRWEGDRAERHVERLRSVARAAAMQSRCLSVPEVTEVQSFAAVLTAASPARVALAVPDGAPPSLDHPVVLIGPEGGWSPAETEAGAATVGLGPGVLRTESAAVAAGALMAALRVGLVHPARS